MVESSNPNQLWFDVGIKKYTTVHERSRTCEKLWFDVGIKRYTTIRKQLFSPSGCGLM